jgi:hypothetical protein
MEEPGSEERLGNGHGSPNVKFVFYPNGTVMIYISCSDKPFRLYSEEDISEIMTFLRRVEERLRIVLSETRDEIVVPICKWILTGCDVNKDIEIDGIIQLTLLPCKCLLWKRRSEPMSR